MPTGRKALAWLLFCAAMTVWGFICALVIANLVGLWSQEKYVVFVLFLVFLIWVLDKAYEWWAIAPWKLDRMPARVESLNR